MREPDDEFLVIGAGPAGLATARALKLREIPYEQVEATGGVGGNWRHGVFTTTHIISSRKTTEFPSFPMPDSYPDFPSRAQMLSYLEAYEDRYALEDHIRFDTKVTGCRPIEGDRWEVSFEGRETRTYKGVFVCNGHHWDRRWPTYPGELTCEYKHSKDYKRPEELAGKRVLVIGGGNSACDIVSEAARVGASAHLSQRRGYWVLPKSLLGRPITDNPLLWLPISIQRLALRVMLRLVVGKYEQYGLMKPDHAIFDRHPTVNDELFYYLKHGKISPHPDVARWDGNVVEFVDGVRQEFDLVVACTGFNVSFPFLPEGLVPVKGAVPQVYGGAMIPEHRHLYIVGWAQARYGFGPLLEPLAEMLARVAELQDQCDHPIGAVLKSIGYKPETTHLVDPIGMLRRLRRAKRSLGFLPMADRRLTKKLGGPKPAALSS